MHRMPPRRHLPVALVLLFVLGLAPPPATAALIFRMGDTVFVDGKQYSWEEWKKIRDNYRPEPASSKDAQPLAATTAASAITDTQPRAASCNTTIYHDEFPSDDERFECSSGLGAL